MTIECLIALFKVHTGIQHIYVFILIISDVAAIQEILIKQYEGATRSIPVMPLEDDEGVSLSDIYGSALVEEDIAATRKSQKPNKQSSNKGLDSTKDMFYVNEKLAKRIFMKGEVGHGKTVFCLKVIELWAKAKSSNESISEENSSNESVSDDDKSRSKSISEGNARKSTHSPQYETTEQTQSQYEQAECKHSLTMQADDESELGECLSQFDLVFYVPVAVFKT